MNSPFDLALVVWTLSVASTRVFPDLFAKPNLANLYDVVVALNPVVTSFWLTVALAISQVLLSAATRSFAWNDRFWSLIPPFYALLYGVHPIISSDRRTNSSFDPRLSLMSLLIFLWGARLTFNAARRGFYTPGFVDYRYGWIQAKYVHSRVLFCILYSIFSCGFMTVMLALASSPLYFAWISRGRNPSLSTIDIVAAVGVLASISFETVADNQQHAFHTLKKLLLQTSRSGRSGTDPLPDLSSATLAEVREGFLQSGLFAWSRHPNFFAEMCVWWFFYLFSVSSSGRWLNWTLCGPVLYTLLFQITTPLTERISSEKYSSYSDYQARVSRIIPSPFSRLPSQREKKVQKEE